MTTANEAKEISNLPDVKIDEQVKMALGQCMRDPQKGAYSTIYDFINIIHYRVMFACASKLKEMGYKVEFLPDRDCPAIDIDWSCVPNLKKISDNINAILDAKMGDVEDSIIAAAKSGNTHVDCIFRNTSGYIFAVVRRLSCLGYGVDLSTHGRWSTLTISWE